MNQNEVKLKNLLQVQEYLRIGNRAVKKAQENNRKNGIPNVYDFNGHLYYELPNGELTITDPLLNKNQRDTDES